MRSVLAFFAALVFAVSAGAQKYNPKAIKLQGADGMDQQALMRLIDLPPGSVVTKAQIDGALQRLGDSGLFSQIRYSVDSDALVFIVTPAPGSQALPVRFANFVWWKPAELESLLEARVPLYHGKLPLTGQLTDQVEAALVALLADKGIYHAQVSARLSTLNVFDSVSTSGVNGITISLDQPQILVQNIHLTGTPPEVAAQMQNVLERLSAQDFDTLLTPKQIVENAADTLRNDGFLDGVVEAPFFSAPYPQTVGFGIDASATVYPGARYRVSAISFEGAPPALQGAVAKAAGISVGEPAGVMALRIAEGSAARALENLGMLDASAMTTVTKDRAAHTVAYRMQIVPGPVYSFAGIDVSALTPAQQALFQHSFHAKPGAVADGPLRIEMNFGLRAAGVNHPLIQEHKNRTAHTVTYAVLRQPQGDTGAQ